MASYYDTNPRTCANAKSLLPSSDAIQHFPSEGLYLGELTGGSFDLPALYDLQATNGLCFLYNNEHDRRIVNTCLEKFAWRLAITVPAHLCELVLYNGGNPGEFFSVHTRMNKYLFDERRDKVYFDGSSDLFLAKLNDIYVSIVERMAAIRFAGKKDLVDLNESLGNEARMKYTFILLTDFPRHLRSDCAQRIAQIIESGREAGVYVMMSWDMNADIDDSTRSSFDPRQLLSTMELLFPKGDHYAFRGSGHDDVLNRFHFEMDQESIDLFVIEKCLQYIDILTEVARKQAKPAALKQDFEGLEKAAYKPVMNEICVTIGLDVRDKHPVTFKLTSGDYIHGFILGQSGSGKSVLLNNIITSLILKYSPEDLMLYLMDFKGVEFNRYRGVKHTKAVLVDNSDPQMTLEVLRELNDVYDTRRKLFSKMNVSNIDGYNRLHPNYRLPQILFVADECQVMFKEPTSSTERILQREIAGILNTIATQGRFAGIHMLLATQQLDEADISGEIIKNLTECFLLMSAPGDSDRLVDGSSSLTSKQMTGIACYYHKKELQSQVQTFFATDDELASAIAAAQEKAGDYASNGGHYFCGSSSFYLYQDGSLLFGNEYDCPISLIGENIGINAGATTVPLRNDFLENILIFGANKKEQSVGVALNALASLIISYRHQGIACDFIVIDCLVQQNCQYRPLLKNWAGEGLIRLVPRSESGGLLHDLVEDIDKGEARPTLLAIIGQERFIEMRRDLTLNGLSFYYGGGEGLIEDFDSIQDLTIDENAVIPVLTEAQIRMLEQEIPQVVVSQPQEESPVVSKADAMKYSEALNYILDEGPLQGVHILMFVDKPGNIVSGDDYDVDAARKCRHKIILRSENKYLDPFRFSQDIDVEVLSDELEHLRAWYYPDGDDPILFTPYLMPAADIFEQINTQ